ncbi:MAG TPA: hypothetical protein VHC49_26410 [Mycobacteriales bacterium]|nr:hypothetical protein [Mycobacteriales bacterium]
MTDEHSDPPPARVVHVFGGDPTALTTLAGGQGMSWRAGDVVLKPAAPHERIDWLAAVLAQVPDCADYRVARPVPSADGEWVVDGWSATEWRDGRHLPGRWEDALNLSAALHEALSRVGVEPLPERDDPWSVGMSVAWGDQEAPRRPDVVDALLDELSPLLNQDWNDPPPQIIHGDLGGNIVYADGQPPAVIDFSPHRAPAPFADAIIVADGTAWENAPTDLAASFAATRSDGAQLLARAVVYRVITVAQLVDDPGRIAAEIAAYRPVAEIALSYWTSRQNGCPAGSAST